MAVHVSAAAPRGPFNFGYLIQALSQHTAAQVSVSFRATLRGLHGELGLILELRFGPVPPPSDIAGAGDPRVVWQFVAFIDLWSVTTSSADLWGGAMRLSTTGEVTSIDEDTQERWRRDGAIAAVLGRGGHRGPGSGGPPFSSSGSSGGPSGGSGSLASEARSRSDRRGAPDVSELESDGEARVSPSDQWLVRGIERAMAEVSPTLMAPTVDRLGRPLVGGQLDAVAHEKKPRDQDGGAEGEEAADSDPEGHEGGGVGTLHDDEEDEAD